MLNFKLKIKSLLILFTTLFYFSETLAAVFNSPVINRPKAPGKIGSRELDWIATDTGALHYNVPILVPNLRQLNIDLAVKYTPQNSYSEVGPFWGLNIPKIILDTKRGNTKTISSQTCFSSLADNLYVNGLRMIPVANGKWVSNLNSARDVLQCAENGFVYYNSSGEIFYYGSTFESQVASPNGEAIEWYLSRRATFQGNQIIEYTYQRPVVPSAEIGIKFNLRRKSQPDKMDFISKPLLVSIAADEVKVLLNYEKSVFYNPHFNGGFPQVVGGRVTNIVVQKNSQQLRNYKFRYESQNDTPFPRLRAVQEFGADDSTSHPETVFSYRVENFAFKDNFESANQVTTKEFPAVSHIRYADIEGTGKTQAIMQDYGAYSTFDIKSFEPTSVFPKDGSRGKLILQSEKKLHAPYMRITVDNTTFIDFSGSGLSDLVMFHENLKTSPSVILNTRTTDDRGRLSFNKIAEFADKDFKLARCMYKKDQVLFGDFNGNGRTDFVCIREGYIKFLFNNGLVEKGVDAKGNHRYDIDAEYLGFELTTSNIANDSYSVVDWNADGLPDILELTSSRFVLYLNNGRLANGERSGRLFERVDLGEYPYDIGRVKMPKLTIGDFTGTGLPSINLLTRKFLINNGLGKPMTGVRIGPVLYTADLTSVVQLTGDGKQQIISTIIGGSVTLIEFPIRSFPNLLHSVATSDGRFLSFNYTSSVLENSEAIHYDHDEEVKNIEKNSPVMPVVIPLLKQTGLSDGFNPTRMWRYSYRVPYFDRAQKRFLGYSLVRTQTVGDETQPGTLTEKRFLSGFRLPEMSIYQRVEDTRLSSERTAFSQGEPLECLQPQSSGAVPLWCNDLSGHQYYTRVGAAADGTAFATGLFNTTEKYSTSHSTVLLSFLNPSEYASGASFNQQSQLGQILEDSKQTTVSGQTFLRNNTISKLEKYFYDPYGRLTTKISSNEPVLNNDNLVTNLTYFCPLSHPENPKIYCDNIETTQTSSSQGSVKPTTQKIIYDYSRGLPLEEWSSNQTGELVLQATAHYDNFARINYLKYANGQFSTMLWDENTVNLKSILDQDGLEIQAEYDAFGQITEVKNSRGSIHKYTYDSLGRILSSAKNLGGQAPLQVSDSSQSLWEIFINWLKRAFGFEDSNSQFKETDLDSSDSNNVVTVEKYEYSFPSVNLLVGNSIDEEVRNWNHFDATLTTTYKPEVYNETTIGKIQNSLIKPGFVSIYKRNNASEELTLVSKTWLSGVDEPLFTASRVNNNRFIVTNKSNINSLGKVYKDYLNSEMSLDSVLKNELPNFDSFKLKAVNKFYSDGSIFTQEFDTGSVLKVIQGVDFEETISPEGRRSRKILNLLGQIAEKQLGLDSNGNVTKDTLITNVFYDALGRIFKVTNNDGLDAQQSFAANNQVDYQINNALGVSRFFYDNYGRMVQSVLCPVGTNVDSCNILNAAILNKTYSFNEIGKLTSEEHLRFERENGTHSKELVTFTYGSINKNNRKQDIGLPISVSVLSQTELGTSESIKKYAYNRDGIASSEDLELFLKQPQKLDNTTFAMQSVGVYQLERINDLSGNLVQLRTRGGFTRNVISNLKDNYFTGYLAHYESGTSLAKTIKFLKEGVELSTPLQNVNYDSQGYNNKIDLENNLQLLSCWHKRKEVPLSFWAGQSSFAPSEICDQNNDNSSNALVHTRWQYDNDLNPVASLHNSNSEFSDPSLSASSLFTYDAQGRLASTRGVGDDGTSWGSIHYEYSVGGKINKVTRSGHFIKNRISQNSNSLTDTYSYSQTGQLGVLQNVLSTDGFETAKQEFSSDAIGFRKFGVSPTLAVLTPTPINNLTGHKETNKETYYSSWKNRNEIPMQKYVWNGRGQLAGVFAASLPSDDKKPLITHELLNYRMSDESGGQLAEFDGVAFENNTNENVTNNSNNNAFIHPTKLARFVSVGSGISFERDELHINIDLGSFATLRLITRYPTLNASSPETLKSSFMQSRKELVVKDLVGSVSQVIDLESKKIVERNSSEPFGLSRGIPLLTNAVLADYKAQGARADVSLYSNPQSNRRENWQAKSFEVLGDHPQELQGLRGTVQYAQGKFSAATGMHSMGVRTLDSARGVWLSPDLYMGRNLEGLVKNPLEANVYQYANNNPIAVYDPTGQYGVDKGDSGVCRSDSSGSSSKGGCGPSGDSGGVDRSNNRTDRGTDRSWDCDSDVDFDGDSNNSNNGFWGGGKGGFNFGSAMRGFKEASNSPAMDKCLGLAVSGIGTAGAGMALEAASIAAAVPSAGISVYVGSSIAGSMIYGGSLTALAGIACIGNVLMRGDGSGEPPANFSPPGAGSHGAFRKAKRDLGIPMSRHPDLIEKVEDTTNPGKYVKNYVWGSYKYENGERKFIPEKVIQHHKYGHYYGKGNSQNRGPHYNGIKINGFVNKHYDY